MLVVKNCHKNVQNIFLISIINFKNIILAILLISATCILHSLDNFFHLINIFQNLNFVDVNYMLNRSLAILHQYLFDICKIFQGLPFFGNVPILMMFLFFKIPMLLLLVSCKYCTLHQ
jgi:hypothetical protein